MTWRNFPRFFLLAMVFPPAVALADDEARAKAVGVAMAAEFAFQTGHYTEAARHYLQAAQASPELAVAERATRMAILAGDESLLAGALARWRQLQPDSPERAGLALRLALRSQQAAAARTEAETLLAQGSAGSRMLRESLEGAHAGSAVLARQLLRELMASVRLPADVNVWLSLSSLGRTLLEPADVGRFLLRMPGMFPGDPRATISLALWQREQGESAATLATLASLDPAQVSRDADRRQVAAEYLTLQRYGEAERWLASVSQDATTYRQRLAILVRNKDAGALSALSSQLNTDRGLSASRRNLLQGQAAELVPDWKEAERRYRDIRNGPELSEAQLRLAFVLQKQMRTDDALRLLRRLQDDEGASADSRRDAYALEALMLKPAPRNADIEAYGRGLAAFKGDFKLLYGRAMRYIDTGHVDAGLADLRQILDAEPEHPAALNAYGYTLADRKQAYSTALPFVEQALRLQPDSPAVLDSLGFIRLRLGRHAEALPLLERAWTLQPDPEVAAHFGELLWLLGRRDEAGKVWRDGLALEPDNRQILALQEKFRP